MLTEFTTIGVCERFQKNFKTKRMIRIIHYQMITNRTYSLLSFTVATVISVSIAFTKLIQTCEIVQTITRLKQDLQLGEVERRLQNKR